MKELANVNGQITLLNEAKISVMDRGFLYGDSIYEVVRTYNGIPFFLEEHTDRLENSARLARMKISQSRQFLHDEIKRTVVAAEPNNDVFIRYCISRGVSSLDLDPAAAKETSYIIFIKELPQWNLEFYRAGMRLAVPKIKRNSPLCLDPNIKCGNYLNNVIAVGEAKELGYDDALLMSLEGKITEASNSNISFVIDGKVVSPLHEPETSTGNLKGLTKRVVSEACKNHNIAYSEKALNEGDVSRATEAFVTSATREVAPVLEIRWASGRVQGFPTGGGPLTQHLQSLYKDYVTHFLAHAGIKPWFTC